MDRQPLADDLAGRHARRERAIGVLEHDLHPPRAAGAGAARTGLDVAALEADRALAAAPAAAARGRAWSCRCRSRRPGRPSRPRASQSVTPSTAFTWPTVRRSRPRRIGKWTLIRSPSTTSRRVRRAPARGGRAARSPAASACRGGAGRRRPPATAPCSTASPSFITTTRSAWRRTICRSWVISSIAMPRAALEARPAVPGSAPGW